jgi:hypothetical protein
MSDNGKASLEDLRAQRDALERQLAQATIEPTEAYVALLGGEDVSALLDRLTAAAASLDDATRLRLDQWIKAHKAMVTLSGLELARLRKLID